MEVNLAKHLPQEAAKIAKEILKTSNSQEEVDYACAGWALTMIDEFRYKPSPSMPALLVTYLEDVHSPKWKRATREEKEEARKRVEIDEEVASYKMACGRIFSANYGHAQWLEKYIELWLKAGQREKAVKCWEVYKSYPSTLALYKKVLWKKKVKFARETEQITPEIENVLKEFNGEIVDIQQDNERRSR